MVCLPAFGLTGEAALLDLETLECMPLRFAASVGGAGSAEGGKAMDVEKAADSAD